MRTTRTRGARRGSAARACMCGTGGHCCRTRGCRRPPAAAAHQLPRVNRPQPSPIHGAGGRPERKGLRRVWWRLDICMSCVCVCVCVCARARACVCEHAGRMLGVRRAAAAHARGPACDADLHTSSHLRGFVLGPSSVCVAASSRLHKAGWRQVWPRRALCRAPPIHAITGAHRRLAVGPTRAVSRTTHTRNHRSPQAPCYRASATRHAAVTCTADGGRPARCCTAAGAAPGWRRCRTAGGVGRHA
jgi:hypothetical protein